MWEKTGLNSDIINILNSLGYNKPTEIQEKSIKSILNGNDLVGGSATGSGKTFAFALPSIQSLDLETRGTEVLILCPTRELASQVAGETKKIASKLSRDIQVVAVYGGEPFVSQVNHLIKKPKIIVGTPGRVLDHLKRKSIRLKSCKMLVLDEADEMLSMGFRNELESIIAYFKEKPQMLLFSATMPNEIKNLIDKYLQEPKFVLVDTANKPSENVEQFYIMTSKNGKLDALKSLIMQFGKNDRALIFCNTKAMTTSISEHLRRLGFKCDMLNGDMTQKCRNKVLENFKNGTLRFLVCTDVASRGLDIDNLPFVVNYDLPNFNEWYIHRIGRTGRSSKKGKAYTILNKTEQLNKIKSLAKEMKVEIKELQLESVTSQAEKQGKNKVKAKSSEKRKTTAKNADNIKIYDDAKFQKKSSKVKSRSASHGKNKSANNYSGDDKFLDKRVKNYDDDNYFSKKNAKNYGADDEFLKKSNKDKCNKSRGRNDKKLNVKRGESRLDVAKGKQTSHGGFNGSRRGGVKSRSGVSEEGKRKIDYGEKLKSNYAEKSKSNYGEKTNKRKLNKGNREGYDKDYDFGGFTYGDLEDLFK